MFIYLVAILFTLVARYPFPWQWEDKCGLVPFAVVVCLEFFLLDWILVVGAIMSFCSWFKSLFKKKEVKNEK